MALLNTLNFTTLYPDTTGANLTTTFSNVVVNTAQNSLLKIDAAFIVNTSTSTDTVSLVLFKTYKSILANSNSHVILSNLSIASNTSYTFLDRNAYITLQEGEYIQGMSTTGLSHFVVSTQRIQ